ncbi:MAG: NADH-quinone oxidoreductase subunit A [Candidatus Midichloria sp.]|nr:NADH-quinone oxidoreductase subunit A [Candidatus Midichloria sp.]
MSDLPYQYMPILIFLVIALALAFALLIVPFFAASIRDDKEKLSQYECGFETFDSNVQSRFDIRFYLVSILFIIFDLEIAFLFPWALVMQQIGIVGFVSMMTFLVVLMIGFIYEWKKGALDWE